MYYENELGYMNVTAQFSFRTFTYGREIVLEYWVKLEQVKPVQIINMDKPPLACVWSISIVTTVRFASSEVPEKFLLLNNVVVKEAEVKG
jgi:hypothetical protein